MLCAKTFMHIMTELPNPSAVKYSITLVDDVLQEDKPRVNIFVDYAEQKKQPLFKPFFNLLNLDDKYSCNVAARLVTKLACWSRKRLEKREQKYFIGWLVVQLNEANNIYIQSVARSLQTMLRVKAYQNTFVELGGVQSLLLLLTQPHNFQTQYQLVFSIWVLTLNTELAVSISKTNTNLIPVLTTVLCEAVKEKVIRIVIGTFRNILEKPKDISVVKANTSTMAQFKVLKQLQLMEGRMIEDHDIVDDINYLLDALVIKIQTFSTFDEYADEIKSGKLHWSPMHKSFKFWSENASKLMEKNAEVLRNLVRHLATSKDPIVVAVAAHDIGEFVQFNPTGKMKLEKMGTREFLMEHLQNPDATARYESLIALQKIMAHNWEYLGIGDRDVVDQ